MPETAPRGELLVAIARNAIAAPDDYSCSAAWEEDWLREHGASFVTLKIEGELRGCIGTIEPHRPLGDDVAHNARAAAYRDPRFPPLASEEMRVLQVEVSVLSPREEVAARSESEALSQLRPGVDGVLFEYQHFRSTFLPQVWESLPEPEQFMGELRRKAGLPARFWHPEVRLFRYTVEKYR